MAIQTLDKHGLISSNKVGPVTQRAFNLKCPFGAVQLQLDCSKGTAEFTPTEPGFPAGTLDLDRLTFLAGLFCDG